jgi:malate permease and related proteins
MLVRVLTIIAPVLLLVLVGFLYARWRKPDLTATNALTVDLLSPMLIFSGLANRHFSLWDNRWLLLGGLMVMLGSGLLAAIVARLLRYDSRTFVAPMMFNNAAYMGLPLTVLAFGADRLPPGIALFVLSTLLHMTIGIKLVQRQAGVGELLRSPLLAAAVLGLVFNLAGWVLPPWLGKAVSLLGDAAIPFMLFSLGARMSGANLNGWQTGLVGAMVCPLSGLLVVWALHPWLPLSPVEQAQLLLFGALPPAVLNFLIAERYHQEPDKVASMVLFGNIASVFWVPLALQWGLG